MNLTFQLTILSNKAVWCDVNWNHATQNRVLEQSKETLGSKEGTEYLEQPSKCVTIGKDNAVATTVSINKISRRVQILQDVDCDYYDENPCNLCGK